MLLSTQIGPPNAIPEHSTQILPGGTGLDSRNGEVQRNGQKVKLPETTVSED